MFVNGFSESRPISERFEVKERLIGAGGTKTVRRYRYRTPALTGPWRDSHEEAVRDATRAKQAKSDDDGPDGLQWIVPGRIEEQLADEAPTRLRN